MSDQSGLVSIPNTVGALTLRDRALEGFAAARRKTILVLDFADAGYTLNGECDQVHCDLTGGNFTVNLPAAPVDGDEYEFLNTTTGTTTIGRNGKTINGAPADVTVTTLGGTRKVTWSEERDTWWFR
jgi:hypothetical protein